MSTATEAAAVAKAVIDIAVRHGVGDEARRQIDCLLTGCGADAISDVVRLLEVGAKSIRRAVRQELPVMATGLAENEGNVDGEQWLPIPGYENLYKVSTQGRVYSMARRARNAMTLKGRFMAQQPTRFGHTRVNLRDATGRRMTWSVHRLVALAFLGSQPGGCEVRHLNGVPNDNRLENLAWGTKVENSQDTLRHGRHNWASRTECAEGHPLRGANLSRDGKGARVCLACKRGRQRRYEERKRQRLGRSQIT